ncbi:GNAT family N-acetyltransferase [Cohnella sp. GCM10020058]|uniref:GNAT family N-acetyltransferase n=1 Tax=Cohnella sp. GCM10020058 TaxID=3317330 RepID=UPI0036303765
MIKKVQNEMVTALFNFVWMTVWREKGFEFEFSDRHLGRYLAVTPQGEAVGTAEIKPYRPGESALDSVAPFERHERVAADPAKVAEIDKIALLKAHRGAYLSELLTVAVGFARANGYHYYLSLLEPVFYRALRITYRIPMEKAGDAAFYKGDTVIPVVFDMKAMYERPENYDWLRLDTLEDNELAARTELALTKS